MEGKSKKLFTFLCMSVIWIFAQSGLVGAEEVEVYSFHATVLEVYESSILAVPYIGSEEYDSSDRIYVGLSGLDEEALAAFMDEVEVYDSVAVEYNGVMLETYPVQITALSIAIDGLSETAELVKAQITREGFLVESAWTEGGNYEADSSENLRILPSAWEDDPEGDLSDETELETNQADSEEVTDGSQESVTETESDRESDAQTALFLEENSQTDDADAQKVESDVTEYPSEEMEYLYTLGLVTVFHYTDGETAWQVSECFDPDDPSEFSIQNGDTVNIMVIDYIAPIRLYLWEDCIILYCGTNETVQVVLDEAFGEPFAANEF
ncbi:MAG: hypothetical protein LUF30_01900 [Lachnospiraceae bacterium]|nr:hypothetical protein [Lachnospiraceae bacterium]